MRNELEALLYEKLPDKSVSCGVCLRRCRIPVGQRGFCLARENRQGTLVSLIHGAVSACHIAEAERKPLYHFYPGERFLSVGTFGCNFRCPECQNHEIAHADPANASHFAQFLSAADLVESAKRQDLSGISWTYNEPTIWFEYVYEGARLAKNKGLLTNLVTNGSMTPEALEKIGDLIDAFRVDIKGYCESTYVRAANFRDARGIRKVVESARKKGMHVECVTNVIPTLNDADAEMESIACWIRDYLGAETPWHITRFHPVFRLSKLQATPAETLERFAALAREKGLAYVYIGNVPGHSAENTYCAGCRRLLIQRFGFEIRGYYLAGSNCPDCGLRIYGRFRPEGLAPSRTTWRRSQ